MVAPILMEVEVRSLRVIWSGVHVFSNAVMDVRKPTPKELALSTLKANQEHQYALASYAEKLTAELAELDKILVCFALKSKLFGIEFLDSHKPTLRTGSQTLSAISISLMQSHQLDPSVIFSTPYAVSTCLFCEKFNASRNLLFLKMR